MIVLPGMEQMRQARIKELMLAAIEQKRPAEIEACCRKIWNQPFFYKIDKARALTISYNPTDKGARTNYPELLKKYQENEEISSETIYNLLYNFKKEPHWRRNYDWIFQNLSISEDEVAHMDISSFPYNTFQDFKNHMHLDDSKRYALDCLYVIEKRLKYILIDGKHNRDILPFITYNCELIAQTKLPKNKGNALFDVLIYQKFFDSFTMSNQKYFVGPGTIIIYFGSTLWGQSMPSNECINHLISYIKDSISIWHKEHPTIPLL